MISEKHKKDIQRKKIKVFVFKKLPYIVFWGVFTLSYYFHFEYKDDLGLFNDKLIDVSSIFFGIFIGCLYLFEKFKNNNTYSEFLKFCRILLYQNVVIIVYSFLIMLINDKIMEEYMIKIRTIDFKIYPKVILFSMYIALFSVVIINIIRFISIILKILKYR